MQLPVYLHTSPACLSVWSLNKAISETFFLFPNCCFGKTVEKKFPEKRPFKSHIILVVFQTTKIYFCIFFFFYTYYAVLTESVGGGGSFSSLQIWKALQVRQFSYRSVVAYEVLLHKHIFVCFWQSPKHYQLLHGLAQLLPFGAQAKNTRWFFQTSSTKFSLINQTADVISQTSTYQTVICLQRARKSENHTNTFFF